MNSLSAHTIRLLAPSVFADHPHESRSEKYSFIPTSTVLESMTREGFDCTWAGQSKTRIEGKREFTRHMLRFSRPENVGDTVPEVLLINSHDGSSAYKIMAGAFRFVCANGLIVADSMAASVRVAHKGDIVRDVIEGSYEVIASATEAVEKSREWRAVELSTPEQVAFARAALEIRFEERIKEGKEPPIGAAATLHARRSEDRASDLWTTFNRVQENLTKGGSRYVSTGRYLRTRAVTGIDSNVGLNRALWRLAEEMKALKA